MKIKKTAIIIALFVIGVSNAFSQIKNDSIVMKKRAKGAGYVYYQNEKLLTIDDLVKIMKNNEQAYKQIKSVAITYTVVMGLAQIGGGLAGWGVGNAISSGDSTSWTVAAIGAGIVIIAFPIGSGIDKNTKQAVETYNKGLQKRTSSIWDKKQLNLVVTNNGIGLKMNF